jgi:hypothetical protein
VGSGLKWLRIMSNAESMVFSELKLRVLLPENEFRGEILSLTNIHVVYICANSVIVHWLLSLSRK